MRKMVSTILVVDDEKDILELLKYNLEKEGYKVLTAHNGRDALRIIKHHPDLVVLDIMMPELDGWEVCKAIRKDPATAMIPIMFLTARDSEVDEVVGLELGADDYIVKPVKIRTFIARVKRALKPRTERGEDAGGKSLKIGDLEIQTDNYVVKIKNRNIHLPKKEFEVLLFLARHPDRVVSRETLLNEIWGHDVYVVDRTIDVHVRKIREKLGHLAEHIETVKGVGYRFRKDL
jgi:two-component system alkaline phosphatase synthesis response regulator PhoP